MGLKQFLIPPLILASLRPSVGAITTSIWAIIAIDGLSMETLVSEVSVLAGDGKVSLQQLIYGNAIYTKSYYWESF